QHVDHVHLPRDERFDDLGPPAKEVGPLDGQPFRLIKPFRVRNEKRRRIGDRQVADLERLVVAGPKRRPGFLHLLPPAARQERTREEAARPKAQEPQELPTARSEEHTSELQSRENLVCRLLLEKKK